MASGDAWRARDTNNASKRKRRQEIARLMAEAEAREHKRMLGLQSRLREEMYQRSGLEMPKSTST